MFFNKKAIPIENADENTSDYSEHYENSFLTVLNSCADLIARTVSKCEFITFDNNERVRLREHFLFNIRPSVSHNGASFWYEVVYKLALNGECLVLQGNNCFEIATFFYADFDTKFFTNITVEQEPRADIAFSKAFYFKLSNKGVLDELHRVAKTYDILFSRAVKTYRQRNALKFLSPINNISTGKTGDTAKSFFEDKFKRLLSTDDSFTSVSAQNMPSRVETEKVSSDIERFNYEIISLVSIAHHVPISMLVGSSTISKEQINDFYTFAIEPICKMIESEINSVYYGESRFVKGEFIKINTTAISHIDVVDKANFMEAMIRSGMTLNEINSLVSLPAVSDEIANVRFMTKNYDRMDSFSDVKGGEENE